MFSYLYSIENMVHKNLNGNFFLKINNKNNKLLEKLNFDFLIEEGKINLVSSTVNLKKIGKIKFSNFEYLERVDKLYFKSRSELFIYDEKQFYRRFQIPREDRINLNKIYFDIEVNVDDGVFYLFNMGINSKKDLDNENVLNDNILNYEIENLQQLTKVIRDTFNND